MEIRRDIEIIFIHDSNYGETHYLVLLIHYFNGNSVLKNEIYACIALIDINPVIKDIWSKKKLSEENTFL